MVFSIFSTRVNYYKNGIFWWSKLINRVIGERNYDKLRLERRIFGTNIYYKRQQFLYTASQAFPDIANTLGCYPKLDTSHGFPNPMPFECYRDFQENTMNSDGWFAMFVCYVCLSFAAWTVYCYMLPYYWANFYNKNEEDLRLRMRDYLITTVYEEIFGNQFMEFTFTPHNLEKFRGRFYEGYANPDDVRLVHMSTFNRKHRYREHYIKRIGTSKSMINPG